MVIASSDMLLKFSVTAAAVNTTAGTAPTSLGDQISTTQPTDNTLNNWFGDYTAAENAALVVKYRCLFIHNNHATDTWNSVVVYISSETASGVSARNGTRPVSSSYATMPSAYTSVLGPTSRPCPCSGLMYSGVPTPTPVAVCCDAARTRAMPKSATTAFPERVSSTAGRARRLRTGSPSFRRSATETCGLRSARRRRYARRAACPSRC